MILSPRAFDADEIVTIDRVYETAWVQLEARDPLRDKLKDDEWQAALRKRVFNLARSRKVEFDTLYRMVLRTIPRNWMINGGASGVSERTDDAGDATKVRE